MPNKNGTGPLGLGPVSGRGRGLGVGRGRGLGVGKRQGGTKECICPKCGYSEAHVRGVPCTTQKCPKCGTTMKGIFCLGK